MADDVGFVVNIVEDGHVFSPNGCSLRQYYSNNAPHSFIHLPPTLYNVFLPALQFSPVCIIPPLLHTHSFIYHPRCIMFFSQYHSFPCQYHSTIVPYSFIHLSPTLYNVFLPVLQFSPVSIIPPLLHIHSFTYILLYQKDKWRLLRTFQKTMIFRREIIFTFFVLKG